MYNIMNVTCAEIQSAVGFLYVIHSVILNQSLSADCEQGWYSQDRRLIADPSKPQTLIDPATSVSSDHLSTSSCVNLNHEIICDSVPYRTLFRYICRAAGWATPNTFARFYNLHVLNEVTPDFQHSALA
ncbi:hypothetical protein Q8A67_006309 [Cirrhinus molitorella]|uniref:Uncharacterized protein n=1 Tax=Cirrhinus molitorella TaxID=172907 RepID=A0AA88Q8Y1_9TELE|nr:hypothetical protein Q8A67_006309 [Cirrhinus molitorella]